MKKIDYDELLKEVSAYGNSKEEIEKSLFELKSVVSHNETIKECFAIIYFPAQILLWSLNLNELSAGLTIISIMVFTVIFVCMIGRLSGKIFRQKLIIEQLEKKI